MPKHTITPKNIIIQSVKQIELNPNIYPKKLNSDDATQSATAVEIY